MATAETIGTAPQYYLWWFPGSPVKVHLALSLVERLKRQWSDFGPSSSQEGLLFGETREGATEILDFQPATHGSVTGMVEGLSPERKRSLVGYYRTESGKTFQLNARDLSLASDCFARPYNVFLLVRQNHFGPPTATFFFHDRDCRMAEFAFLEFPFDASLLAADQYDRQQRSRQAIDRPLVIEPPAPLRAPLPPPARGVHRSKRGLILRIAGWAVLLATGVAIGTVLDDDHLRDRYSLVWSAISNSPSRSRSSPSAAASASQPAMSLHAIRRNGDLEVTWDRSSPLIASALSGALSIRDGQATRLVPFNASQLQDGSLLYVPTADQIFMQLTVTTPANTYSESVTVILPPVGEPRTYPVLPPKTTSAQPAFVPAQTAAPVIKPSQRFTAPSSTRVSWTAEAPLLQDPPALNDKPIAQGAIPGIVMGLQVLPPRPPAALPQSPAAQLQLHLPRVANYEPPVPIVKTDPKIPAEVRKLILKRTVVQVDVDIDQKGRVTRADTVEQKGANPYLLRAAIEAAWSWTFKAARSNDEPVASKWHLQFVFNP